MEGGIYQYQSGEDYNDGEEEDSGARHIRSNQNEDDLDDHHQGGDFEGFGEDSDGEEGEEIVSQNSVLDLSSH